jgi:putative photosynthetic complex assembly protein 2
MTCPATCVWPPHGEPVLNTALWLPPLAAIAVWWLGTGLVMLLDSLPRDTFRFTVGISTAIAVGALVCIAKSAHNGGADGAYAAFVCAVLVWAWHELSFLTGWLTGPRREAYSRNAQSSRFQQAVQAILWHELALLATAAGLCLLTWNAPNQMALHTFVLLWVMRLSAKLNLFLGVRNWGETFLPPHLVYLASYFRRRRMNALWPVSVLAALAVTISWSWTGMQASGGQQVGGLLLATLLALAVLEHLMMVLPFPPEVLWRWAQRRAAVVAP